MDNDTLAELFLEQADFRDRKAEEYPDDTRNKDAADAHRALAESAKNCPMDVISTAEGLCEDAPDTEVLNEMLRQVGFGSYYESAEDFLRRFIANRSTGAMV